MLLDVFKGDGFNLTALTTAINLIPYQPTRLGKLNWFTPEPISTTTAMIEFDNNKLTLVPAKPRGAPGTVKGLERRKLIPVATTHLPQTVSLMADEVQNLRAFGEQTEEELGMNRLKRKMAVARRDLDITHEWQRMGALKGQVLDADGTTVLYDFHTLFGTTPSPLSMALGTATTKILQKCMTIKRMVEDKLGGRMYQNIRVLCSPEFMDAFVGHPVVQEAYKYQMSQKLREDYRGSFEFGDIIWEEYRGTVNGQRFLAAGEALAVPEGVSDLFITHYAPAPYMDTVNTDGLPFYAKMKTIDFDKGVEAECQSNPLHLCTQPDAIVTLTI